MKKVLQILKRSNGIFNRLVVIPILMFCFVSRGDIVEVGGTLESNTTWTDTVFISETVFVPDSVSLIIMPGTYVEAQGFVGIRVGGILKCEGTAQLPIIFTVNDTTGFNGSEVKIGGWQGLHIEGYKGEDSTIISHSIFQYIKNTSIYSNGSVYIRSGHNIRIKSSVFRNNRSSEGGAIGLVYGTLSIDSCSFISNASDSYGGGAISAESADILTITNCLFDSNKTSLSSFSGAGGAINLLHTDSAFIERNVFDNNSSNKGGAIHIETSYAFVRNNTFKNNFGRQYGGAINLYGNRALFVGNLLTNNSCGQRGIITVRKSIKANFINNTIVNNHSASFTDKTIIPAVNTEEGSKTYSFVNCLFFGNVSGSGFLSDVENSDSVRIINSLLNTDSIPAVTHTINSLYEDPQFKNPSVAYGQLDDDTEYDFSILDNSKCVNRGILDTNGLSLTYSISEVLGKRDLIGEERVFGDQVDIGALENPSVVTSILSPKEKHRNHLRPRNFTISNNHLILPNNYPYKLSIFSISGRLIKEISGVEQTVSLNDLNLATGVYQVKVTQGIEIFTGQFILR